MYRISICENSPQDRTLLYELLESVFSELKEYYTITRFTNGEDFLENLLPYQYDIAFFDIEMGRVNGIEAAKRLRDIDKTVLIIFTTAFADKVFGSFAAEPFQYLVKPVQYEALADTMRRASEKIRAAHGKKFSFSIAGNIFSLPIHRLLLLQSDGRNVEAVSDTQIYRFYGKLSTLERDPALRGFIRCHQSFLVNPAHIQKICNNQIWLSNGSSVSISKGNVEKVKSCYMRYALGELP